VSHHDTIGIAKGNNERRFKRTKDEKVYGFVREFVGRGGDTCALVIVQISV